MAARMQQIRAIPAQQVTVDCDPKGWPYIVTVGGTEVTAWPEKYKVRGDVRARLTFRVPELGSGTHPIIVRDSNSSGQVGVVII